MRTRFQIILRSEDSFWMLNFRIQRHFSSEVVLSEYFRIVNSLEDILIILKSLKSEIFKRFDITYLAILESSLSDEPVLTAGLGVVVEFDDFSSPKFIELQDYLSNLLRRSVHLIVKNGMSKVMLDRMNSDIHVL